MTQFDFAAAIKARPSGAQQAHLIAAFGNPEGPGAMPSAQGPAWFEPSPQWRAANLVRVPVTDLPGWPAYPGSTITAVTVHRLVAPVLVATWAEVRKRGLNGRLRTYNGAFAARHMGHDRSRPLSVHAFGAAIDFDAAWNGYGVPLDRMQIDRDVVRCFEECGWTWGGHWTGQYADGMHLQWTDPLPGVPVPAWQDAMAHRGSVPAAPAPAPAAPSGRGVVLSQFGRPFEDIDGSRVNITGAATIVINATDPGKVQIRVEKEKA
ncbi:M15 family metallopeptidase [Deinococcus sp. 12RED42]|uniref:M15 family metallopeptidase n=1 Tax=Deinococcus sp. 12RED42 TaxID=2745872 RepID=UPI001E561BDC|nr:M15 family metallopeptidase [Deinococcus sp. 12RED42]MCD0165183.1 M15 family metallopeptidase [Deinococcus sp. 12RED42]